MNFHDLFHFKQSLKKNAILFYRSNFKNQEAWFSPKKPNAHFLNYSKKKEKFWVS